MNPLDPRGAAIHADLHQVSMAAGCWDQGITQRATFEISFPELPPGPPAHGYVISSGLDPVLQYLLDFRFAKEQVQFLRNLYWFHPVRKEFWDFLGELHFTGDLWAPPEGTPVFPGEPILRITAPVCEALLVESYVLATLSFSSAVATLAARFADAAGGKAVIDFGLSQTASPGAAVLAARAAYASGAVGSSNAAAGVECGVPVFTSSTPAFVLACPSEADALRAWHGLFRESGTLALGTHDAIAAARKVAEMGLKVRAVRIDRERVDLAGVAREVRRILDEASLESVKIGAGGDLDEAAVAALAGLGAPIDFYCIGGAMGDPGARARPRLVADLVEMQGKDGGLLPRLRRGPGRTALPGVKQVYRSFGLDGRARRDLVALAGEKQNGAPVLQEWMKDGVVPVSRPGMETLREYTRKAIGMLPPGVRRLEAPDAYKVETTPALAALAAELEAVPADRV